MNNIFDDNKTHITSTFNEWYSIKGNREPAERTFYSLKKGFSSQHGVRFLLEMSADQDAISVSDDDPEDDPVASRVCSFLIAWLFGI